MSIDHESITNSDLNLVHYSEELLHFYVQRSQTHHEPEHEFYNPRKLFCVFKSKDHEHITKPLMNIYYFPNVWNVLLMLDPRGLMVMIW